MKILIAYDGSQYADLMLDDLRCAGIPQQAEVLILSVAERWLPPPDAGTETSPTQSRTHATAYELAERASASLIRDFPSWSVLIEAATGSPAGRIVQRAQEWKADLITLGSLGHSALERILIGSVSHKVANEASCSVRICRRRGPEHSGKVRILLGYDGMEGSDAAVRAVAGRRWPHGASVLLLTSVGFGYSPAAKLSVTEDHDRARQMQSSAERILRDSGLEVSPVILEGDPKLTIVEQADFIGADSIFIGNNDRRLAYRLFLGTVASAVVSRARCSVEIIRS